MGRAILTGRAAGLSILSGRRTVCMMTSGSPGSRGSSSWFGHVPAVPNPGPDRLPTTDCSPNT